MKTCRYRLSYALDRDYDLNTDNKQHEYNRMQEPLPLKK